MVNTEEVTGQCMGWVDWWIVGQMYHLPLSIYNCKDRRKIKPVTNLFEAFQAYII